jgi:hypothetical protein
VDTRRERAAAPNDAVVVEVAPVGDEAIFAIERLPRGRGLKAAGAVVVVMAGLASAGLVGNALPSSEVRTGLAAPTTNASGTPEPPASPREWTGVKTGDDRVVPSFKPLLLALDAQATGGLLFVHGDVYTRGAMLVVVSVADQDHRTLDVRSINMPGGSTAFRTGPNDRFSLAIPLTLTAAKQPAWVLADAYDHNGAIIASARVQVGNATGAAPPPPGI